MPAKSENLNNISDIDELTNLFTNATNLNALLENIVDMILSSMKADLCLLYVFDDDAQKLILKAMKGLGPDDASKPILKQGEGFAGIAFKEMRPFSEGNAADSEGKYLSYLAIPILRGQNRIGVIMLQSLKNDYFSNGDIKIFRDIIAPLVTTIEMAKLLFSFDHPHQNPVIESMLTGFKLVQGRVGAEGFASGNSIVFSPLLLGDYKLPEGRPSLTMDDFHQAVIQTERELYEMQKAIEERMLDVVALIFSAQIMMLKDQAMIGAMESMIETGIPPQDAVRSVIQQYVTRFDQMANEYVREKRYDVIDVGRRIMMNMIGNSHSNDQYASKIIIVRELLPSDVLKLSLQQTAGIVLLSGGVTSHVAILARSLNIPLVIIDEPRLLSLPNGSSVLLDGDRGNISIDPSADLIVAFRERQAACQDVNRIQKDIRPETRTKDGTRVILLANINILSDLAVARDFKVEGVGLYRTEFPFLLRGDFPSEEEQYVVYCHLIEDMKGHEITFRTLDIGGDKMLSYYDNSNEANPFLGLRSIRFSLKHLDIFICQIRAILRASFDSNIRIMFPMISSVEEFVLARDLVLESVSALESEGKPHQGKPLMGAMIEVPSIIEVIDELAQQADFFSIGTNDLIQYMLAVDRTNEKVADCYIPHHPAILRAIKRVADAALRHHRCLSVCGDMAHDPRYIRFFIGIGIRKFSLDSCYLPKIQQCLTELDVRAAEVFARQLLENANINETAQLFDNV